MRKAKGRGEARGTCRPLSCWATATALYALALSTLTTECSAACNLVTSVVPIQEFGNPSEVSITGTVPSPGACSYWQIQVNNVSSCSQSNSTMLLEMWLEDQHGTTIYPGMNIPGLFLMATRSMNSKASDSTTDSGPSSVVVDARGNAVFWPSQKADDGSKTYVDDGAMANFTTQRFAVPVGHFLESPTWLLSLQSTAALPLSGVRFSVRVTCVAAPNQLPCPRPARNGLQCNSTGQCVADPLSPGKEVCACSNATAGSSCNIPVTDMSRTGNAWLPTYVPGQSWTYFNVSVAAAGRSRLTSLLLVELQKQAASMDWSQPVVQLRSQSNASSLTLPYYAAIDPQKFNIEADCLCANCSRFIPYQAEYLSYEFSLASIDSNASVFAWVIGIFNNAPYTPGLDSGALMIRARTTVSDNNQVPPSLCPMNCSGQGNCLKIPAYGAMYACDCNPGYAGPYCQGQLRIIPQLSTSRGFQSPGAVGMEPGELDVYLMLVDQNSIAAGNNVLTLSWSLLPASLQAFLVLNPRLPISVGQRYFEPELAYVLNATSTVPYPFPLTLDSPNSYFPWWYIGVYNSNRTVAAPGSYTLSLSLPGDSGMPNFDSLINKLQLGIIGAVAALIILLLSFMTIRVLILRRHMTRSALGSDLSLSGMSSRQTQQQAPRGVPPAVAESFPTFTYSKEEFVQHCQSLVPAGDARSASLGREAGQRRQQLAPAAPAAAARVTPLHPVTAAGLREEACERGHDAPQCSVCICNYEEGDVLRQLPCNHIFHKGCIDPWLTTHVTCPNCRTPLTPGMQLSPLYQERAASAAETRPAARQHNASMNVSGRR